MAVSGREHLTIYAKHALAHMHEPAHLRTSPLASLLVDADVTDSSDLQLAKLLREAVQSLMPAPEAQADSPARLLHKLLYRRYVLGDAVLTICHDLGFSQATFYRYEKQALDAVACFLWDAIQERRRSQTRITPPSTTVPDATRDRVAKQLALNAVHTQVYLAELLNSAVDIVQPLLEERQLVLRVHAPASLPSIWGDPALLRQVLLGVLCEGARFASAGTQLDLAVVVDRGKTIWTLRGLPAMTPPASEHLIQSQLALSRDILAVFGGQLVIDRDPSGAAALCFTVPAARGKAVLVIDDDKDASALYVRYLRAGSMWAEGANSAIEARECLMETQYDLILLDVLMPSEDGWDILQELKTDPATSGIPVVVCSVLGNAQLARALGAERILRKPIDEASLLTAVTAILSRQHSQESPPEPVPGHTWPTGSG